MTIRVKTKANVIASEDVEGKNVLFGPDDETAENVMDGFTELVSGKAVLVTSGVHTVNMGAISDVRGIYLRFTANCSVAINGAAPLQLRPGITKTGGVQASSGKFLVEGLISSVVVTAAAALELTWCAWGDPTA